MSNREEHSLEVGDVINFKVLIAYRLTYGRRKVVGFSDRDEALVHFNGCKDFVVHCEEITKIVHKEDL